MKITYFINQYPLVSHTFIRREILALVKQGVDIHRVALRGWDSNSTSTEDEKERELTAYILISGVLPLLPSMFQQLRQKPKRLFKVLIEAVRMSKRSERNVIYHLIYLLEACKLAILCKEANSSHIHAHFGTNSTEVVMLTSLLEDIPYSFTVHGPEEFDSPLGLHLNEKVRNAKFVAAISSYGRSQLYRWSDYKDWQKIKVVHCGLDESFLQGELQTFKSNEIRQFLCIGRLCEQKGQLLLIKAFKNVIDSGQNVKLILAGDGDMRGEIEAYVNEHNLAGNIEITGWINSDQVKQLLIDSDAMILPSFAEGLPVAIMESMAIGVPVLTTYIAGIPELITNNENGILFPAGDIEAVEKGILDFLNMPEESLKLMRISAYESVAQRHNINTEAKKLAEYFQGEV